MYTNGEVMVGTGNGGQDSWIGQHEVHGLNFSSDQEMRELFIYISNKYDLNYKLMIRGL